jgi:protein tyrosine phosphatase (PTP) superfamily phosphohydrolase (DUF442 family)
MSPILLAVEVGGVSLPSSAAPGPEGHGDDRAGVRPRRQRWRSPVGGAVVVAAGAVVAAVVATNVVLYGGLALARLTGSDPRSRDRAIPSIEHLRRVDDRLWAGDQPTPGGYRSLAHTLGVKRVVNLRTGEGPDPLGDDPAFLASLGIEYVWLPVHDGHAPDPATVRRFLELVDSSPGPVYAHCGGGVGRSSVMEAAYRASRGSDPSVLDQLFLGPVSLEQAWFGLAAGPGRPAPQSRVVRIASRVADYPRPYFSWLGRQFR